MLNIEYFKRAACGKMHKYPLSLSARMIVALRGGKVLTEHDVKTCLDFGCTLIEKPDPEKKEEPNEAQQVTG
jgi:hypothetical protein